MLHASIRSIFVWIPFVKVNFFHDSANKAGHERKTQRGNLSIGFEVEDMESAARHLTARGVALTRFENGEAKFALFSDPDGAWSITAQRTRHE
jgi:hypothetical protein